MRPRWRRARHGGAGRAALGFDAEGKDVCAEEGGWAFKVGRPGISAAARKGRCGAAILGGRYGRLRVRGGGRGGRWGCQVGPVCQREEAEMRAMRTELLDGVD